MGLKNKYKDMFDEEKAVINTAMAGLNEKDIFPAAKPEDLEKRGKEFSRNFPMGAKVRLKNDVGFYDYETGGGQVADKGKVGKIINLWGPGYSEESYRPTEATVEFPDGSAGIFGFDDLEPINEDIFKPAKKHDVEKRQKEFRTEAEKAYKELSDITQEFLDMYTEFTRDDEDPPEYLQDLRTEIHDINRSIHPSFHDPIVGVEAEEMIDARNKAKELLKQLKIYVTGEDIDKNATTDTSRDMQDRRPI